MEETKDRRSLKNRLFRISFFCLMGLTAHLCVLMGAVTFGHPFVPSEAYVSDHGTIAKWVAILIGCSTFAFCCRKFVRDFKKFKASDIPGKDVIFSGLGLLVLPVIFGIMVRAAVLTAYPLWLAALFGTTIQLEFSVDNIEGSSLRCPHRVDLEMPLMTGTLCGVSDDFRQTLHEGVRVELTGRGTADGLFAAGIDVVH